MPIHVGTEIQRMDEEEFKACVYEVMRQVFAVHNELGRLFDEKIYQREFAFRVPSAQREVPIEVRFEDFCKTYYIDLLVGGGALFEMKTVESLAECHQRQLMHYLFLTGLPHGKLVNMRPERVEHEFVNNTLSLGDRTGFAIMDDDWREMETTRLKDGMVAALRDWGTGLDLGLYEEVAGHLCGQFSDAEVEIRLGDRSLGTQRVRLVSPGIALRITALPAGRHDEFAVHIGRFLEHTGLRAVQWINVTRPLMQFRTILGKRR